MTPPDLACRLIAHVGHEKDLIVFGMRLRGLGLMAESDLFLGQKP